VAGARFATAESTRGPETAAYNRQPAELYFPLRCFRTRKYDIAVCGYPSQNFNKEISRPFDGSLYPQTDRSFEALPFKTLLPHERLAVVPPPMPVVRQSERGAGAA
jgi:hypothetical protein